MTRIRKVGKSKAKNCEQLLRFFFHYMREVDAYIVTYKHTPSPPHSCLLLIHSLDAKSNSDWVRTGALRGPLYDQREVCPPWSALAGNLIRSYIQHFSPGASMCQRCILITGLNAPSLFTCAHWRGREIMERKRENVGYCSKTWDIPLVCAVMMLTGTCESSPNSSMPASC